MLYGSAEQRKFVLDQAQKYADSIGVKLIFGAMLGSVSEGVHYSDSDYDVRFLYLRNDFPEFMCVASEMTEDELVKRYYLKNNVMEKIPLWEATSFFRFLIFPSFRNDFSLGLYNTVSWTFMSPYTWDPYGLQNKVVPLINRIFRADFKLASQKDIIDRYRKALECKSGLTKPCFSAVHAAATIEWCLKYQEHAPIDLQTLLQGLERDYIWKELKAILDEVRKTVRTAWKDEVSDLKSIHSSICVDYPSVLLKYIDEIYNQAESATVPNKTDGWMEHPERLVNYIYEIIYQSVFENEPLLYRGRSERT